MNNVPARDIFKLENIEYTYENETQPIVSNFNLHIARGESVALKGPVGSGKTTLFHIALGLIKPDKGTIWFDGDVIDSDERLHTLRRSAGLLFQNAEDQLFCPTVIEDLAFGPVNLGMSREEAIKASSKTLESLGLKGYEQKITHKLSGGEKKLVALGTILVMNPELIFLDEPLSNLDEEKRRRITSIIKELPVSKVIISHDSAFLNEVTDRTVSIGNQ